MRCDAREKKTLHSIAIQTVNKCQGSIVQCVYFVALMFYDCFCSARLFVIIDGFIGAVDLTDTN